MATQVNWAKKGINIFSYGYIEIFAGNLQFAIICFWIFMGSCE